MVIRSLTIFVDLVLLFVYCQTDDTTRIRVAADNCVLERSSLLLLENHYSKQFVNNIRKYNSAFQMTSSGCTERVCLPGFMPTFKVQGQVYHRIGAIQHQSGENPEFLQIYLWVINKNKLRHDAELYLV